MKKLKSIFLLLIVCLNLVFLPTSQNDVSPLHAEPGFEVIESILYH